MFMVDRPSYSLPLWSPPPFSSESSMTLIRYLTFNWQGCNWCVIGSWSLPVGLHSPMQRGRRLLRRHLWLLGTLGPILASTTSPALATSLGSACLDLTRTIWHCPASLCFHHSWTSLLASSLVGPSSHIICHPWFRGALVVHTLWLYTVVVEMWKGLSDWDPPQTAVSGLDVNRANGCCGWWTLKQHTWVGFEGGK